MSRPDAHRGQERPPTTITFPELIDRIRDGCQEAFTELYRRYNRAILRDVDNRLLRRGDPLRGFVEPEDIGQETWIAIFVAIEGGSEFPTHAALLGFAHKTAANCCHKRYRDLFRTAKRARVREESLNAAASTVADKMPGPAAVVQLIELWEAFLARVPTLDEIVMEEARNGWTAAESAQGLGLPVRRVRSKIRHRLRQWESFALAGGGGSDPCRRQKAV